MLSFARRIEETEGKWKELTLNVDEHFYDALDALRSSDHKETANQVAKSPQNGSLTCLGVLMVK